MNAYKIRFYQPIKLYFDENKRCLGGVADNWWLKDYSGDYWASEYFSLPVGYDPRGVSADDLTQIMTTDFLLKTEDLAQRYNWIKYQQLSAPEDYLWVVLRTFRDEYVVHLYNSQQDGHYYGVYCGNDLSKAEQAYQDKLAYYRGEKREKPCPRPDDLMEILREVRHSNSCNMIDLKCVCYVASSFGYQDAARWLKQNSDRYLDILNEFGEWSATHPEPESKSLAQQLADEMGWQVITD